MPINSPRSSADGCDRFDDDSRACVLTGNLVMSVPLHWIDDEFPIGMHFLRRIGDEALLFRLAAQFEEALPWANRRSPTFAT